MANKYLLTFTTILFCLLLRCDCAGPDYVIYISPNIPMVNCTIGTSSLGTDIIAKTADASGYDVALISSIAISAGWAGSNWVLVCTDWDSMVEATLNGTATFASAGIPITSAKMNQGLQFSLPTYSSGLKMVAATKSKEDFWSFLSSFETWLWVLILATTFITGIVTFIFEEQTLSCKNRRICMKNLAEMLWQAFSSLFFASEIRLQKFSARIMFLTFWFMVLVLSATYTADLTTKLASNTPIPKFTTLVEAAVGNYRIETYKIYHDMIGAYNLKNLSLIEWGPEYALELKENFLNETIDGFVADAAAIDNFAAEYPCRTYTTSDYIVNFNYGFMYPPTADATFIDFMNLKLFNFKEGDQLQDYVNKYINVAPLDNSCNQSAANLDLFQLAGLWIILGAALIISLIIHLIGDIIVKGDKKLKLLLNNRRKQTTYTKEEKKMILETYPMIEDFIHIPSKDLHQQVEKDIKDGLDNMENLIRERFLNAEKRVLMTLRKINNDVNQNESEYLDMDRSSFIFDEGLSELQASEKISTDKESNSKAKID